jgi:glycosyltransferase 2 family protein
VNARGVWWRVAQIALALVVVGIAVRKLAINWTELRAQDIVWSVRPLALVASALIVWSAYALLIEAWRRVVVSMQQRLAYGDAARICMVSNLGKYIPGKVWAIAGNAVLAQRAGVEPHAAVAAAILNQALAIGSGVILVSVLSPAALRAYGNGYVVTTLVLGAVAIIAVLTLTSPRALRLVQRVLPGSIPPLAPVSLGVMLGSLAVNALAWVGYGIAFLVLARGLTPDASLGWTQATTVFTISYLVGLVALFAPGGVGVRESAFTLLLAPPLGLKLAVALALATRVLLTVTELGAAAPFFLAPKGVVR